jgi:hypothetical protein
VSHRDELREWADAASFDAAGHKVTWHAATQHFALVDAAGHHVMFAPCALDEDGLRALWRNAEIPEDVQRVLALLEDVRSELTPSPLHEPAVDDMGNRLPVPTLNSVTKRPRKPGLRPTRR